MYKLMFKEIKSKDRNKFVRLSDIGLFLWVFYFVFLPVKHLLYFSNVLIPASLLLGFVFMIFGDGGVRIPKFQNSKIQYLWLFCGLLVLINNYSLINEIISGGVIQFLLLIGFVFFMPQNKCWIDKMLGFLSFLLRVHCLATIIFALLPNVYYSYCRIVFPFIYSDLVNNYSVGRIAGLCSNYSTNGIYLSIGLIVSYCYYLKKKNANSIIWLLLFMIALLFSGKRGPLVFSAISLIVMYFYSSKKNIFQIVKLLLVIICFGLLFLLTATIIPQLKNTINRFAEFKLDSTGGRQILYDLAITLFKENALLGVGWGGYKHYANHSLIGQIYGTDSNMLAHNCYLQLLSELGIVGSSFFYLAFIFTLFITVKKINRGNKYFGSHVLNLIVSLGIQLFFLLYCLSGNPLYDYPCLFPYLMFCGVAFYKIEGEKI